MSQGKEKEFYEEITKVTWGFISDKLKIQISALSRDNAFEKMVSAGVNESTLKNLKELLEYCEMSSYAGKSAGKNISEIYNSLENIISSIENEYQA
jgi:hypothetical protein